jgi:hypothetical protein
MWSGINPIGQGIMSKRSMIILMVCLLLGPSCATVKEKPVDDELLLSLVLRQSYEDGGYTVVAPQAKISRLHTDDPEEVEHAKRHIQDKIKIEGYDIGKLVDLLFERNKISVRLSLKSSPEDGYVIDYDGKYAKYFQEGGGGWEKWYKENPKAHGWTSVSLPAYDANSNVFLVYVGTQLHWLSGAGWIIAFKYEDGKLKELGHVMLWIS